MDEILFDVRTRHRKKLLMMGISVILIMTILMVRLGYIMIVQSDYYIARAEELHERERKIKAARGRILDTNGVVLADNKTVCTVSVIHSQITDPENVSATLARELNLDVEEVAGKVNKKSSIEKIATNIDKETGDRIREFNMDGVKVDEDYKRYYPYDTLASKVLGFTGSDNQGIVGLEAKYDNVLMGNNGKILTLTDAWGVEIEGSEENREEPIAGSDLYISMDVNIQMYAQQLAEKAMKEKNAKRVAIIVMNPQNGEILAMVNTPEYDLNHPYELIESPATDDEKASTDEAGAVTGNGAVTTTNMDQLNNMWRNFCINDTYEPGSVFKMFTASTALETKAVSLSDTFNCCGYAMVADRRIRCAKTTGHGQEDFTHSVMNSCNPAFIEWGRRVGVDRFFLYLHKMGILTKTGIDLPGEATTIMHKQENVGEVELATMSFGQSFQITPIMMLRIAATVVNGGKLVTPHFAVKSMNANGVTVQEYAYDSTETALEQETSDTMKEILRQVVEEGGGNKAYIEGYSIGGKTATSEKLPRGTGKYISSFIGFSTVKTPRVIAMCLIDEPEGVYYGGTISAPVIRSLFENILPYLEITDES